MCEIAQRGWRATSLDDSCGRFAALDAFFYEFAQNKRLSKLRLGELFYRFATQPHLPPNRTPLGPEGPSVGNLYRISDRWWASETLAFCFRVPDIRPDPLGNKAALQFGKGWKYAEYHAGRDSVRTLR